MLLGVGAWSFSSFEPPASVAVESARISTESGNTWLWSGAHKESVQSGAEHSLKVGDRVLTGSGRARLEVGSDTRISVAQQSEVVLSQYRSDLKSVMLRGGLIDVDVEPRRDGRVEVETPHARIVVHGTQFSVAVSQRDESDAATSVRVRRGVVAVWRGGHEVARLRAGEYWSSKKPGAKEPGAKEPGADPKTVERAVASSMEHVAAKPASTMTASRVPARRPTPAPKAAPAVVDASTLAEQNKLFRLAIDARNRSDDERAVKHFDALLAKFPHSALAQEARVERFRALKRLGRNREAARAARRYLMDHTNGFAKDEARGLALTPGSESPAAQ
jgi:hypothetical protein